MKIAALMVATLSTVGMAAQAERTTDGKFIVTVYVQADLANSSVGCIRAHAEGVASTMFATAGVRVNWRTGQPHSHDGGQPILIDITSDTPVTFHKGALAYAQVFEGIHIRIFYDRVERPGCPRSTTMLLAHVLVHEITHLLEGIDRHSDEGIMKAHWTIGDLAQMARTPLSFDPADVELIRMALASKASSSQPASRSKIVRQTSGNGLRWTPGAGDMLSGSILRR